MRHTRQEAKALGLSRCYGSVCSKHEELEGLRYVSGACVACAREALKRSRANNPERTREQKKKDYAKFVAKPDLVQRKKENDAAYRQKNWGAIYQFKLAWNKENADKVKLYASRVRKNHKGKLNAHTVSRRLAKLQRTPSWLTADDNWMLEQAYELAALRTKLFGFAWHVDHIVPLQGKLVSGLHTPLNIQVIPGADNVRKGNRFVVT